MREAEDVVDEEQGVDAGLVAEVLGHGEGRERHPQAGARRLVHLAEDHDGLVEDALAGVADLRLLHLQPDVVALARPLADAGEAGVARVEAGEAGDQLLDDDRLADARAAEEAGLAAAHQRAEEVDDLDPGLEELGLRRQLVELRRRAVDRAALHRRDRTEPVDRLADQVEDAAERSLADRHGDRRPGVEDLRAALQALGRAERHRAHFAAPQVLRDLAPEGVVRGLAEHGALDLHPQRVVDRGQLLLGELRVEGRADDLGDRTVVAVFHWDSAIG